jgi:hypothetical protein
MDAISRLKLLSSQMTFEPDLEQKPTCFTQKQEEQIFVHPAQMPNGQSIKLLKTLLSSACERDCFYCPFRAGRDFRRATFQPEEFAKLFMQLHQSGLAEGVFSVLALPPEAFAHRTNYSIPPTSCATDSVFAATCISKSCPVPSALRSKGPCC